MRKLLVGSLIMLGLAVAALVAVRRTQSNAEPLAGTAQVISVTEDDSLSPAVAAGEPGSRRGARRPQVAGEDWLTSFELIERSGKTVRSEELKGTPYVVGFFFTLCPSICVNQNAKVKELQDKFKGRPVRLLSISCDPEVDRPEVLRAYAERFDADPEQWLFLTGDMDYISRVAAEMYFLAATRRFHAEKFVLVDAAGNNVGFYNWNDSLEFNELQRDMEKLLAGQEVQRPTVNAKDLQAASDVISQ